MAGRPKGLPKTGGRKKGSVNKRIIKRDSAVREAAALIASVIDGAFEGDAHALLMAVYKDPSHEWPLRIDAAKAAVRYEKPALASVDHTGEAVRGFVARLPLKPESSDEWLKQNQPRTIQ